MKLGLCLILVSGLILAGCTGPSGKWPVPVASAESRAAADLAGETRQVEALLGESPQLLALSTEDARRELQVAGQATGDSAKLRLAWLLTLGIGGRNDARLLIVLDELAYAGKPAGSPLRQMSGVMHRVATERIRAQQESQARTDTKLRETEQRLKEAQARADDLQQKLDAIMNVERTLNQRSGKRK